LDLAKERKQKVLDEKAKIKENIENKKRKIAQLAEAKIKAKAASEAAAKDLKTAKENV
jgi:hypothetical protein